jgi:hypothetical protein
MPLPSFDSGEQHVEFWFYITSSVSALFAGSQLAKTAGELQLVEKYSLSATLMKMTLKFFLNQEKL